MELWEIALQEKGLYHIGRSKRDGAPHGSGRYPLGSGDRPYQYKEEAKAEKYRHDELERISQRRSDHFQKSSKKADRYARTYKKEMTKAGRRGLDTTDKAERALDKYQYTQQLESYSYLTDMLEHTKLSRMSISELQTDAASLALVSKTFDRLGETKIKEINELAGNNGLRDRKDLEALGRDIRNKAYDKKRANSDFDGGSSISKATASNRKKAQKEYEKFQKNSHKKAYTDPNSNKAYYDLELTPGNTIRASRYQSITGPDNKANLKKGERYTEYKADMKNGTAVGKKLIREATDSKGMGAKTIREEPLTEKDYKYIEDWIRRNK